MPTDPETLIIALTFIGGFASILIVGLPFLARDKRATRMKDVIRHRQALGQTQRDEFAKMGQLRKKSANVDIVKAMLERFKLQNMIASRELKGKLATAGWRHSNAAVMFVLARLSVAVIAALLAFIYLSVSQSYNLPVFAQFLVAAGAGAGGFFFPDLMVKNAAQNRQAKMMRGFPDSLDLLTICVEAGLSIEGAFAKVTEEIADSSPILSQEYGLTSAELAYLGDRGKAYQNFSDRTGLPPAKALSTALGQSEKYGTPVAVALRVLSQESRDDRMSKAERKAGSLPAQLTVPMIVFFLPALFLVIIGPAVIKVMDL